MLSASNCFTARRNVSLLAKVTNYIRVLLNMDCAPFRPEYASFKYEHDPVNVLQLAMYRMTMPAPGKYAYVKRYEGINAW